MEKKQLNKPLIVVLVILLLSLVILRFFIIPKHDHKEEKPSKENVQIKNV